MTHVSQIYRSRTYKILESVEDMKYKTVVGVIRLSKKTVAFVNTGTILVLERDRVVSKDNLLMEEIQELTEQTGITFDQLL
jgi:hypothetical protein